MALVLLCKRSVLFFLLLAVVTALVAPDVASAGVVATGRAFEDRNRNGVFDSGDIDFTAEILDVRNYTTNNEVVFSGGPLRMPDKGCKMSGICGGFTVSAPKITVGSSLMAGIYGGVVFLIADVIDVKSNLTLDGRDGVYLLANRSITIGNAVLTQSRGGSANVGRILINADQGNVTIGTGFRMTSLYASRIYADNGTISMGTGAQLTSTRGDVELLAGARLDIDWARIRAVTLVSLGTLMAGAPLEFQSGYAGVSSLGVIIINGAGAVNLTGTRFSKQPYVTGKTISW